eukprot:78647_1
MISFQQRILITLSSLAVLLTTLPLTHSFSISTFTTTKTNPQHYQKIQLHQLSSASTDEETPKPTPEPRPSAGLTPDHVEPEDAIIHIAPKAMTRLRELRKQQGDEIILRMGVRNGGCSGLSYVMDFSSRDAILEDDAIDEYTDEGVVCVVDAKSMLYLYGLELDYGDELIGGGFKFFNPNAEESCGCGSSFGV